MHLLRHCAHGLLGHALAGRMPGVALSEQGLAQAAALGGWFAQSGVRAVITSPQQRARETAAPIAAAAGLAAEIEPGLDEVDFGAWSGQSFAALASAPGWHDWNAARGLAATPGGETMLAVQARAVQAVMRHAQDGGTVVAISHADVIKAVLAHVLGMPLDLLHRLDIVPASRSVVVIGNDFARVDGINLVLG